MGTAQQVLAAVGGVAAGSFRYWRIAIAATQGGGAYAAIAEVELRQTLGGSDLTTPSTPATASSTDAGSVAANTVANDGASSSWVSAQFQSTPSWLSYDLSSPVLVAQVAILPFSGLPSNAPSNFTLQGSNDGTNFTNVKTFSGIPSWVAGVWQTFDV